MLGAALKGHRDEAIVATKFGMAMGAGPHDKGGSRLTVIRSAEDSLHRLGVDHIDLYQMHQPDPGTPIDETLAALDTLVRSGKVRYLGSSNFTGWEIAEAAATADRRDLTPFVSAQNDYSLVTRDVEAEVIGACAHFGVGMLPYYPLAGGLLTGKYQPGESPPAGSRLAGSATAGRFLNEANLAVVEQIRRYAELRGVSLLDVAIGGLAAQPAVASVIAGATSPEQVVANVSAGRWQPSPDDLDALDQISPSKRPQ